MFERTFTVRYITLKKCFCYVSDKHARTLEQGSALRCTYGKNSCYFTLGQHIPTLKDSEIAISAIYAKTLGFKENEPIHVSLCGNLPSIKTVNVTPSNKDDYEILELMAESVQSTLLDQIKVVSNGQKIVIWISNSLHAVVDIDGIQPVSPGILGQLTEVVIKPPQITEQAKKKGKPSIWSINGFLKYFSANKPTEKECILSKYNKISVPFVFRLHPIDKRSEFLINSNVFDVFVPKKILPKNLLDSKEDLLFSLNPITEPRDLNYFDEKQTGRSITVRLRFVDDQNTKIETGIEYFLPLFVHSEVLDHYNLAVGSKVVLNRINKTQDISKVEIFTNRSNFRTVKDEFKLYVAEHTKDKKLLLNSDFLMSLNATQKVLLKFTPSAPSCLIDGDFIRNGQISVNELEIGEKSARNLENVQEICTDCANFDEILKGCVQCLNLGFRDKNCLENILITGPNGAGKSTLANAFGDSMKIGPNFVHVETVHCKNIKGKSLDSMHKYFASTFLRLVYYQPSILILDDLHVICEKVPDGEQPTQENLLLDKTSEMLADLLSQYVRNNFIQIVATSESTVKLNQHIFASRGVHLFKNIFTISDFDKEDRVRFMRFAFSKRAQMDLDVDLECLSLKTEGFVAQDLVDFVDKCLFESYKSDSMLVNSKHCDDAFSATSSLSLRNVQLHSAGDRDFSDIGGLEDVKKVLIESMLWPAQYANIFGKAPLRLQSGLLLYGPPGTGKTILAGAAARQCNLRLIAIKGPELLSKYIGASEQAVRDVFHKAQSAKPCILFFDEFDSLAPRRGHDNTGVTDRVVNQFLTQLDGVEALTGVCVLAATSRPDLLDPALLRPGRLDRQLLCPLPDEGARLAILRSLSKTLSFAEDVDLGTIAAATEGYSGADLQGILYTAQLISVDHLLNGDETNPDALKEQDVETKITQDHLNEGLRTTRPSLTRSERSKYDRIYAKFQGKGDLTDLKAGKQRATLA